MNVFEKSLFIQSGSVLGHELKPFSAFHASALMLLGSPFMNGGTASGGDIATAIIICSSSKKDGIGKVIAFQNSRIARAVWAFRLYLADRRMIADQLTNHIMSFFDYPQTGSIIGKDKGAIRKSGAPWTYYLVSRIWQKTGSDLDALWNMPLCELGCHKAIIDEQDGMIEIADGLLEERERNRKRAVKNGTD